MVFTTDDDCSTMFDGHPYPDIPTIQIDTLGVTSLLSNLDPHKAPGPDGIPPRFLKETSSSIAPVLTLIYKASLNQGKFLAIGKEHLLYQFLRKVPGLIPQTIDLYP